MKASGLWMQTFSGLAFTPSDPRGDQIVLEDIAQGLANTARYCGQTRRFYSVAEHSVHLARYALDHFKDVRLARGALMHDAAEAYICDIPRPLKALLPGYKQIEARVEAVIADRFGLTALMDPRVKELDDRILEDERCVLLCDPPFPWTPREPLGIRISPDALGNWRDEFLALAEYLGIQAMPPRLVLPPWEEVSDV